MSTLSFTSHFCSPRAPPVKASVARQLACIIRARQLACIIGSNHHVLTGGVLQQVASFLAPCISGIEFIGCRLQASLHQACCRAWREKIIKDKQDTENVHEEQIADDERTAKIAYSED